MSNRLWQLPPTIWVAGAVSLVMGILAYLILSIYTDMKIFSPGVQYRITMRQMKKGKDTSRKSRKDQNIVRDETANKIKSEKFNLTSKRLGLRITYQESLARKNKLVIPLLIVLLLFTMVGIIFVFSKPSTTIKITVFGLLFCGVIFLKWDIKMFILSRKWKKDVVEDLSNLTSFYMHSSERTGIEGAIKDSIGDMNALKVDLEMFLADSISYSEDDALDRFAERLNIKEAREFVNYVKSTERMDKSQSRFMMERLNDSFLRYVTRNHELDFKVKFRLTIAMILISVISAIMIYIAPDIADTITTIRTINF